jgi:hypothetical protein
MFRFLSAGFRRRLARRLSGSFRLVSARDIALKLGRLWFDHRFETILVWLR